MTEAKILPCEVEITDEVAAEAAKAIDAAGQAWLEELGHDGASWMIGFVPSYQLKDPQS